MTTVNEEVMSETNKRTTIHPRQRGERGSGTTITIDLSGQPELLQQIRDKAKADDREPSKYLRRQILKFSHLILGDGKEPNGDK